MTENIGAQLTTLIGSIVPLSFSEAETGSYPYAVYEAPVEPVYDKDGVHMYTSTVVIDIYDKNYASVESIAAQIKTAIEAGMRSSTYSAVLTSEEPVRVEGIWDWELVYRINQYE